MQGEHELSAAWRRKIEGLLRLAQDNSSPHQAAAALAKATRLLAGYGLTVDQFTATDEERLGPGEALLYSTAYLQPWADHLLTAVCRLCSVQRTGTRCMKDRFNGRRSELKYYGAGYRTDLLAATHLQLYLVDHAERCCGAYLAHHHGETHTRRMKRSYLVGYADEIVRRVGQLVYCPTVEPEPGHCLALAVYKLDRVQRWVSVNGSFNQAPKGPPLPKQLVHMPAYIGGVKSATTASLATSNLITKPEEA